MFDRKPKYLDQMDVVSSVSSEIQNGAHRVYRKEAGPNPCVNSVPSCESRKVNVGETYV